MNHFEQVISLLIEKNIEYQEFDHPKFSSTEEAMSFVEGVTVNNALKSLLFKNHNMMILAVLPVSKKLNKQALLDALGLEGKLSMATPEEVLQSTFTVVGTVSPFSMFYEQVVTVFDESVAQIDWCYITPGSFEKTVSLKASDLITLIQPNIQNIIITE